MTKTFLRVAAVMLFAAGASACSSVPDWVDPTTWGGDGNATAQQFPADEAADQGPTVAEASDNGQYPDLANTPDRPAAPSTAQDRQQVASSLAGDRQRTNYSGDALRGGTEAAAAPPPPPGSSDAIDQVDTGSQADSDNSGNAGAAPASNAQTASNDSGSIDTTGGDGSAAPVSQTAQSAVPSGSQAAVADTSAATTQDVASAAAPPVTYVGGGTPAVPASGMVNGAQGMVMADAPLGFRPSAAPALDPSVSQFVPEPIVARYQQTAANAGVASSTIVPASYQSVAMNAPRRGRHSRSGTDAGVGGPEDMSGSVTANFASLNSAATGSVYANTSGATAVVYFANDVAALGSSGREQVNSAVQAWRSAGGQGYVRVVGHSSSRTANMALEKHLQVIFNRSQAYANVVGRALIKAGIPADKVLIEAVGDSQPVYYESMPQGETGNRRAEIFVQG